MTELLTIAERTKLPAVLARRSRFAGMIDTSIKNYSNIFSNCLLLSGRAGTGKTTIVMQELEYLKSVGEIADYRRASGHVTPRALYSLLKDTAKPVNNLPNILVLDDVDCISQAGDVGCYELLKSALDTKSDLPTNRNVYYLTEDSAGFKYNGFCIIITNNLFNPDRINTHQEALLDRVQMVNVDLKKEDMFIYNTSLIEEYINKNPDDLSNDEISSVVNLFNDEVRKWNETEAFSKAKVNFSIRLIKKFIDANRMFGSSWKSFNMQYQRLQAAAEINEASQEADTIITELINPKTGKPFSKCYLNNLKKNGRYDEFVKKLA